MSLHQGSRHIQRGTCTRFSYSSFLTLYATKAAYTLGKEKGRYLYPQAMCGEMTNFRLVSDHISPGRTEPVSCTPGIGCPSTEFDLDTYTIVGPMRTIYQEVESMEICIRDEYNYLPTMMGHITVPQVYGARGGNAKKGGLFCCKEMWLCYSVLVIQCHPDRSGGISYAKEMRFFDYG